MASSPRFSWQVPWKGKLSDNNQWIEQFHLTVSVPLTDNWGENLLCIQAAMLHTLRGSRQEPASKDNSRYVLFVTTSGLLMRDVEQADWRLWQRDNREVCCLGGHNSQRLQFSFVQVKKNCSGEFTWRGRGGRWMWGCKVNCTAGRWTCQYVTG